MTPVLSPFPVAASICLIKEKVQRKESTCSPDFIQTYLNHHQPQYHPTTHRNLRLEFLLFTGYQYFTFKYLKKVLADYSAEIIPYLIVYFIKRFIL